MPFWFAAWRLSPRLFTASLQVKLDNLPPYKEVLDPLIPTPNARPVRTRDFKDGSCIPTLKQLLHEVRLLLACPFAQIDMDDVQFCLFESDACLSGSD